MSGPALRIRLLGPVALWRQGEPVALPASRKVRALLAYLALAPHPVARNQLCELLWDAPTDPRGELRWSLSKLRSLLEADRRRVETREGGVRLALRDCHVDAIEVAEATQQGIASLSRERLRGLCGLFGGDFLEGLDIDRSPAFSGWLAAQRRRFRSSHAAMLEHLVKLVPDDEAFGYLEQWLVLAPFDRHAHERLLHSLARQNRIREGEEHLAATVRLFEAEGLDAAALSHAWRAVRAQTFSSRLAVLDEPSFLEATATEPGGEPNLRRARRASIAVMPLTDLLGEWPPHGRLADALAHDIITRLAKLRSLFVIAQGSVFALRERNIGPEQAGRMLNVDYVVSGSVCRHGERLSVSVELAESRTARVVWAELFNQKLDDAFLVLEEIGNRIVASIASEIETIERNRAILRPPSSLDAWEAHHRGLWHMYRFDRGDNERARHFFQMAVRLDPTFSRAYAGLSFTYFQDVFQGWAKAGERIERAFSAAGQSLMADDRDPAAHWAMGRALWLRGRHDEAADALRQAIDLSPNFALAHYNLAFVHATAGDPQAAIAASDHSRELSPYDPMLFGMFGVRAIALLRIGQFQEAARWAVKAASRPNAFAHIRTLAALSLALAGAEEEARRQAATVRDAMPGYGLPDFLDAFRFGPESVSVFREGAKRAGLT